MRGSLASPGQLALEGKAKEEFLNINHDLPKFCFSHARFYQLRKDDLTLGYSKEHLIKEIFDPEYERLKFENGLAKSLH